MLRQAFRYPFVYPALGILNVTLLGRFTDDSLEGGALLNRVLGIRVEKLPIMSV